MPINLDFDQDAAFKTVKDLCKIGPRVSGSEAEIRAVLLIEERFRSAGLSTIQIMGHEHQFYDAKEASLSVPDGSIVIFGMPCWMSASTIPGGIESETIYIGSFERVKHLNPAHVKNKIVIAVYDDRDNETTESWKQLYLMNPDAVVFLDMDRDGAPRSFLNKELVSSFSRVPSIVVSASQIRVLHDHMFGERLKIVVQGSKKTGNIQSIQCTKEGEISQTILLCAHHDTYPFTSGATDNAAGVAVMLELARALAYRTTHFTYRFISFGGEEVGMKGSQAFASDVDLEDVHLCINFDSIGELPGMLLALAAGDEEMIEWVSGIAMKNDYPAQCRRTATSGGDNIVFAANGIPTLHLASYGTTSGKVSHSAIDDIDLLTPYTLGKLGNFAYTLIENLEIRKEIPFKREVPVDLQSAAKQRLS